MQINDLKGGIRLGVLATIFGLAGTIEGEVTVGFEDLPLTTPPMEAYTGPGGGLYYNGSDGAGGFESGGVVFDTVFTDFGSFTAWSGWGYSTTMDTETKDFSNEFSSISGTPGSGAVHAVYYYSSFDAPSFVNLPEGLRTPQSIRLNNTTWAYFTVRDGDDFLATPFTIGDYFKVTFTAFNEQAEEMGSVDFFLADHREETVDRYILSDWATVDLSPLNNGTVGEVSLIRIRIESTDIGDFGTNTPTYMAVDDMVIAANWGDYVMEPDGWVNTGSFLGWVYPVGDFVWVENLGRWTYLPESQLAAGAGAWIYLSR